MNGWEKFAMKTKSILSVLLYCGLHAIFEMELVDLVRIIHFFWVNHNFQTLEKLGWKVCPIYVPHVLFIAGIKPDRHLLHNGCSAVEIHDIFTAEKWNLYLDFVFSTFILHSHVGIFPKLTKCVLYSINRNLDLNLTLVLAGHKALVLSQSCWRLFSLFKFKMWLNQSKRIKSSAGFLLAKNKNYFHWSVLICFWTYSLFQAPANERKNDNWSFCYQRKH